MIPELLNRSCIQIRSRNKSFGIHNTALDLQSYKYQILTSLIQKQKKRHFRNLKCRFDHTIGLNTMYSNVYEFLNLDISLFYTMKHFVCLKYKPTRVKYKKFRNVCSEDCVIRILCTVNILQGEPKYGHTCRACYEKYKTWKF